MRFTSIPLAGNPGAAETIMPPKKYKTAYSPNYKSEEVVATIWACNAISEEKRI